MATVPQVTGASVYHPVAAAATGTVPGILHAKYYRALVGHTTLPHRPVDNSVRVVHRFFRLWRTAPPPATIRAMTVTTTSPRRLHLSRTLAAVLTAALVVTLPPPDAATVDGAPPAIAANHRRPVPGGVLVPADIPEQNWLPGHRGVDLVAAPGAPVHASSSGTVRFAGVVAGTPVVSVDHGGGLRTTYEPVLADVRRGEHVSRGQVLGRLADAATLPETARRDPGLSWGAVLDGANGTGGTDSTGGERYIDPMTLLGPVQVRLWA